MCLLGCCSLPLPWGSSEREKETSEAVHSLRENQTPQSQPMVEHKLHEALHATPNRAGLIAHGLAEQLPSVSEAEG